VVGATLTLLGLLIGFTFSMAVSRYDQRKNFEEAEANAIGTEYVRADLLPASAGTRVRELLREYTDQRVLFYTTRNPQSIEKINADTAKLQNELWSAVQTGAATQPSYCSSRLFRNERRSELAGIYASCVVEPNSNRRLGIDVCHRYLLQLALGTVHVGQIGGYFLSC